MSPSCVNATSSFGCAATRARKVVNCAITAAGGPPSTAFCAPCDDVAAPFFDEPPNTEPVTPNPSAIKYAINAKKATARTTTIGK